MRARTSGALRELLRNGQFLEAGLGPLPARRPSARVLGCRVDRRDPRRRGSRSTHLPAPFLFAPATVEVPDVTGLRLSVAERRTDVMGLEARIAERRRVADVARNRVLAQSPSGGAGEGRKIL